MSEFERELLDKVSPHDRTRNGNELFLGGVLAEHFKDWQPPKPLVEVPRIVSDFIKVRKGGLKLYGAFHEISKGNNKKLYNWTMDIATKV